jgi:hypothetical protein
MSTEPFNDSEITDVMRFLGYPDWAALGPSIQLGYPAATQPMFMAYDSLNRITATSRAVVRDHVHELICIEKQLSGARGRMRAERVGEVAMNASEASQLRTEYTFWQRKLADLLGVTINTHSAMSVLGMPGGINGRVIG